MSGKNKCIICGGRAGSGEHVFPAALGGRRVDKGIYCETHNGDLGRHVDALIAQLQIINAAIGVRADRRKDVRPAVVTSPEGQSFFFSKNKTTLAPPQALTEEDANGESKQFEFASCSDARDWAAQQKAKGFNVAFEGSKTPSPRILSQPFRGHMLLGATPFRRATLYVALTFLAHHWPQYAHSVGLGSAKREIQSTDPDEMTVDVWWEPPSVLDQLPDNPYPQGHSVTIAVSAEGKVHGLVSYWESIQFGMSLGNIEADEQQRVVTFINPLEDFPPDDRVVVNEPAVSLELGDAKTGRAYLARVASGELPNPVESILATASALSLRDAATRLLKRLQDAEGLSEVERRDACMDAVFVVRQRVFNLLKHGIEAFLATNKKLIPIAPALQQLVETNPKGTNGLTETANAALGVAIAAVASELMRRVDENTLNLEGVEMLIGGGPGIAVIFEAALMPILSRR